MPTSSQTSDRPSPTATVADARTQRLNMVESQVRPSDVTDRRLLRAVSDIARENFVPEFARSIAYMDGAVPLARGRNPRELMSVRTFARLVQLADIPETGTVLEIGCNTGYGLAVLARLATRVVGVEIDPDLAAAAKANLTALGVTNAEVVTAALTAGADTNGPYDAIIVSGAVSEMPPALLDQLKDGARLVAVRNVAGVGKATAWVRTGTRFDARDHFDAAAAPLPGFETPPAFRL